MSIIERIKFVFGDDQFIKDLEDALIDTRSLLGRAESDMQILLVRNAKLERTLVKITKTRDLESIRLWANKVLK